MTSTAFVAFVTNQIRRLSIHFRPPYAIDSEAGIAWLKDITEALAGTKEHLIEAAVTHLIKNHKGRFPAIVEIRSAISECARKSHGINHRRSPSLPGTDHENLKDAIAWLNSDQGQEALRDGWGADFAGCVKRGEIKAVFCDPIKSRRSIETIAELVNPEHPRWQEYHTDAADHLHQLAVSIAVKCRRAREKYLRNWDDKSEPYNDPAFAAIIRHGLEDHVYPDTRRAA